MGLLNDIVYDNSFIYKYIINRNYGVLNKIIEEINIQIKKENNKDIIKGLCIAKNIIKKYEKTQQNYVVKNK